MPKLNNKNMPEKFPQSFVKHAENNKNNQNFCFGHWNSMLGARGKLYKVYNTPNTRRCSLYWFNIRP